MLTRMDILIGSFLKLKVVVKGERIFILLIYRRNLIYIKMDGKYQYFRKVNIIIKVLVGIKVGKIYKFIELIFIRKVIIHLMVILINKVIIVCIFNMNLVRTKVRYTLQ